jgi:hypothetical protein
MENAHPPQPPASDPAAGEPASSSPASPSAPGATAAPGSPSPPAQATAAPSEPEPTSLLGAFNEVLTQPLALARRAPRGGGARTHLNLVAGALTCFALYGAAAGVFQGGSQILVAALKAPLILAVSFLLCLPSLFVFGALAGVSWTWRRLAAVSVGFLATLGLLMLGMLPIGWLFSQSSRYLTAAVWLHVFIWALALLFGWRFLSEVLRDSGARGGAGFWLILFWLVSLQVTTVLRPVLWRDSGAPLFAGGKLFFLEHLGQVNDHDARQHPVAAPAARQPAPAR